MGIHLYVQSPGTNLLCVYLCFASRFLSSSFVMSHVWGRPYIPFRVSTYTLPSVVSFLCRLYCLMTSSEMSHYFRLIYSYRIMGVFRQKLEMSIVTNMAPGVDITLFSMIFMSIILAFGEMSFPL